MTTSTATSPVSEERAREVLAKHAEDYGYPLSADSIRKGDDPWFNRVIIEAMLAFAALQPTTKPDGEWREAIRSEIINAPETADFMAGVPIEAAHQRERWGAQHDEGKAPEDWVFLVGWLLGKATMAARSGDIEKAKHHTISSAAALANWHAALVGADTRMRPGIDPAERNLASTEATASKGEVDDGR